MASITVAYIAVTGNTFTATDFNNLWSGATITLSNGEVTTLKILDDAVTRDKIASNVAGSGLAQAADGSLAVVGGGGYTSTALASTNVSLTRLTSTMTQRFTGTLSGAIDIAAVVAAAVAGDRFELFFNNVNTTATFTITIKSGSTSLLVYNRVSVLNGKMLLLFNGTAWEIADNNVQEVEL